jgi:transcriptional regulator with XRE-family HTH domain
MSELELPDICRRIREDREATGVTQEEMARRLYLSLGAYAAYERGREPRLARLRQIALALGLPEDHYETPAQAPSEDAELVERLERIERALQELVSRSDPDEQEGRASQP